MIKENKHIKHANSPHWNYVKNLHVADAAVVCPRWFGSDAFLTDGHKREGTFVLK